MSKLTFAITLPVIALSGCTMPMHVDVHNRGKVVEVIKVTTTGLEVLKPGIYDCYIQPAGSTSLYSWRGKVQIDKQVLFSFDN